MSQVKSGGVTREIITTDPSQAKGMCAGTFRISGQTLMTVTRRFERPE
jgi:hypothetical protein